MRAGLKRKALHTALAFAALFLAPGLSTLMIVVYTALLAALFLLLRTAKPQGMFGGLVNSTHGEFFFLGGGALTALLFLPHNLLAFQAGMLVLGLADPLAALIGMRWGKHIYRVWGEKKSVEGSAACELVAFGVFIALGASFFVAIIGGTLMAIVEAVSPRGSDNLFLPLAAGLMVVFI